MKRIISIKEYILLVAIIISIGVLIFYGIEYSSWSFKITNNKLKDYSGDILMYCITLLVYIFYLVEGIIKRNRLKTKHMEGIESYCKRSKILAIIFVLTIHFLFWYLIYLDINIHMVIMLGGTLGLVKSILLQRVYVSRDMFVVGNKMYLTKYLNKVIDDFGSNFSVEIEGKIYSIFCGSSKAKKELIKRIESFGEMNK